MLRRRSFLLALLVLLAGSMAPAGANQAVESAEAPGTYAEARQFLSRHTKVLELSGDRGALVAICPEYQGRIMTSACAGPDGPSLGWINHEFIAAGKHSPAFNNYGGEDRFWLGPEGGQFGLWFRLGLNQTVQNWFTPADLNTGTFKVDAVEATQCQLSRRVQVTNVAATTFDLDVQRNLRVLGKKRFEELFGQRAGAALAEANATFVGFESANMITNVGPTAWDMKSGLISIWTLGQFPAGEQTVIIVPYKAGGEQELGPVVQSDYFGPVPAQRLKVTPGAILFRGDGQYRAKLGVSGKRARPFAGSIDLRGGILTLVQFSMPEDPATHFYVNNTWKPLQENAYAGDVFNTYNDGPPEPGAKALGGFYELETLSPTRPLAKGERIVHYHRTFHVSADSATLARLAKEILGVELSEIREFLAQ